MEHCSLRFAFVISACSIWLSGPLHAQFSLPRTVDGQLRTDVTGLIHLDNDGDGLMDILVSADELGWYRNLGGGSFTSYQRIRPLAQPNDRFSSITSGDLDHDGRPDLVAMTTAIDELVWLRNLGNGEWAEAVPIVSGGTVTGKLHIADMDGDGGDDLVLAGATSGEVRWFGLSDGAWTGHDVVSDLGSVTTAILDLDSDGDMDIVVLDNDGTTTALPFLNDGGGSFTPGAGPLEFDHLSHLYEVDDVDGNDTRDLLLYRTNGEVYWLNNDGEGGLSVGGILIPGPGLTLNDLELMDLNGDGRLDLVSLSYDEDILAWRANVGSGILLAPTTVDTSYYGRRIQSADMDLDGDLDLLFEGAMIGWYENTGQGEFEAHILDRDHGTMELGVVADLDGDGHEDLIVNAWRIGIIWYRNVPSGYAGPELLMEWEEIRFVKGISVADVDGNGTTDIVLLANPDPIHWLSNEGAGNFAEPRSFGFTATGLHQSLDMADLNGDAVLDVVFSNDGDVRVGLGQGNGTFSPPALIHSFPGTQDVEGVQLADLDNDGAVDLVFDFESFSFPDHILYCRGLADGTFAAYTVIDSLFRPSPTSTAIVDVDGDGDLDIAYRTTEGVEVWRANNGDGTFVGVHGIANSGSFIHRRWLDADGNGSPDVILGQELFLNDGSGQFTPGGGYSAIGPTPLTLSSDIDRNGSPDLISFVGSQPVRWYANLIDSPYRIGGRVFSDTDGNGMQDPGEEGVPWVNIAVAPYTNLLGTDLSGTFITSVDTGTYFVSPVLPDDRWIVSDYSGPNEVHLSGDEPTSLNNDFGIRPVVDTTSIRASLTKGNRPCGAANRMWLNYANTGTQVARGTVTLELDTLLTYIGSEPEPIDITDSAIVWHFDSLGLFDIGTIVVDFLEPLAEVLGATESNVLKVTALDEQGLVLGTFHDTLSTVVRCAYDPNDKQVSPIGYSEQGCLPITTPEVVFTIRFQNTGNAVAYDVRLIDRLPMAIDIDRIAVEGFSHAPTSFMVTNGSDLIVRFDGIMLPDSGSDLLASQGFVRFRAPILEGTPHLTSLDNTAAIYFDLNEAVITNTTRTLLVDCALWDPVITDLGGIALEASLGDRYQWYRDGEPLTGDTTRMLALDGPGDYTVEVLSMLGCTAVSQPFTVTWASLAEEPGMRSAVVPNPFDREARVICDEALTPQHVLELIDVNGRVVQRWFAVPGPEQHIRRGGLASGLYVLRIAEHGTPKTSIRVVVE